MSTSSNNLILFIIFGARICQSQSVYRRQPTKSPLLITHPKNPDAGIITKPFFQERFYPVNSKRGQSSQNNVSILSQIPGTVTPLIKEKISSWGIPESGSATGSTLIAMSPEYIKKSKGLMASEVSVDLAAQDIYALGIAIYRMLMGQVPFGGMIKRSLTSSILNSISQPPHSINPAIRRETDNLIAYKRTKDPREHPDLAKIKEQLTIWGSSFLMSLIHTHYKNSRAGFLLGRYQYG